MITTTSICAKIIKLKVAILITALASTSFASEAMRLNADEMKWQPGPAFFPKGAEYDVLAGDINKKGLFTVRIKLPADYKLPPHWHSMDENTTVISGNLNAGLGNTIDLKQTKAMTAGAFILTPAHKVHYSVASSEGATIQMTCMGPWDIHYVNPTDDPRNKK